MATSGISNLEQLERQVYESTWSDGLLDLCSGIALLLIGIVWVTGQSVYGTFVAPLMIPVWLSARKHVSEPRIGKVRFSAERQRKEKTHFLGLFLLGTLILVAGLMWYFLGIRGETAFVSARINIVAGLPAALLSIPAIFVAIALGLPRFFVYAAALLISAVPVILLDQHPGWAFIPCAIVCIGFGSYLLVEFVSKYPKLDS